MRLKIRSSFIHRCPCFNGAAVSYSDLFYFSMTLTQKDMSRLSEVAENIAIALKKSEEEGLPSSELLKAYLPQNGMIRVVTEKGESKLTVTKESTFSSLPLHTNLVRQQKFKNTISI